jgi:hypothetical protein
MINTTYKPMAYPAPTVQRLQPTSTPQQDFGACFYKTELPTLPTSLKTGPLTFKKMNEILAQWNSAPPREGETTRVGYRELLVKELGEFDANKIADQLEAAVQHPSIVRLAGLPSTINAEAKIDKGNAYIFVPDDQVPLLKDHAPDWLKNIS